MEQSQSVQHSPSVGEGVYDADGRLLGRVSGLVDEGFEVEPLVSDESELEEIPGQEFGEGFLMWRCSECGEMKELKDGFPDSCPACAASREALTVVEED